MASDVSVSPWGEVPSGFVSVTNGNQIGGGPGRPGGLDPSRVSLFAPESKVRISGLFQKILDRLPSGSTTSRLRSAPRILTERGLSNGHFDPMFWLIDAWFGRKDRKSPLVAQPVRTMALTHFQQGSIRITRARAALWIAINVLVQNREMENGRWLFTHSRRLEMFANHLSQSASLANAYWRSDGDQGGIWFYPRESLRDESPRGRWIVIAAIPEPFAYHFTAMDQAAVAVLPGPIPPHRIAKQGPADGVLRELERDHGGIEAYLRALES